MDASLHCLFSEEPQPTGCANMSGLSKASNIFSSLPPLKDHLANREVLLYFYVINKIQKAIARGLYSIVIHDYQRESIYEELAEFLRLRNFKVEIRGRHRGRDWVIHTISEDAPDQGTTDAPPKNGGSDTGISSMKL